MQAAQRVWARVTKALPIAGGRGVFPLGNVQVAARLNNPEDALRIATVWRCVSLLSETTAALPWHIYKREAGGKRTRAEDHPIEWLLQHEASEETTAFELRRTMMVHRLLWGNAYAEIERDNAGRVYALHLLDPDRVDPGRTETGQLVYRVRQAGGGAVLLPPRDVFHLRGVSADGVRGLSVLETAAGSLSTGVALDESLARFFTSGFRPMGLLKTKGKLSLDAYRALEQRLDEYSGLNRRWKAIPLDQDMDFQPLAISPEDAQLVEMRKFTAVEICRWFGVPPHMAFDLERATFSNIESQGQEFLTYGLLPHIVQMEAEANRKLLTRGWGGLYSKINVNALVRGDMAQRSAYYQVMRNIGVMTVNDVLRLEDMNAIGPEGDVRVMQAQYQPTGGNTPPPAPEPPPIDDNDTTDTAAVARLVPRR